MNRHCHRLVHNARLGALVPAAESARSHGKPASGSRRARRGPRLAALAAAAVCAAAGGDAAAQLPQQAANFVAHGQAQAQAINAQRMQVEQVGNRAILNWQQFNVGRNAEVQFRQVEALGGAAVAGAAFTTLNRIHDANPSHIAGAITQAAGQQANVILVNANGIVFAQGAQVNVHSLTASTLRIADDRVLTSLLGGRAADPQFGGVGDRVDARIVVEEGARLTAGSQGRVMLIAPQVENRGHIEAPDGQVVLAAGTRAFLRAAGTEDPNLRGLLVEVDNAAGSPGTAVNLGTLSAPRGNVTMVGHAVNQSGIARATSSVFANGSVYLRAQDKPRALDEQRIAATRGGRVELGTGSLTTVLPEVTDTATTADGTDGRDQARPSLVRVEGQQVLVQGGATLAVPAGRVEIRAVDAPDPDVNRLARHGQAASTTAWVHIGSGARIDVAGLRGVALQAGRGVLAVELRGDELKDSPINRQGPLRGQTVQMDVERALERAEAGESTLVALDSLRAYALRIERGIAERSTRGGSVDIASEGSAVIEHGVTIDLSGGSLDFGQARVRSDMLSAQGRLVGVAEARADQRYDAIVSRYVVEHERWNRRDEIVLPSGWQTVPGYTEGRDAGSLALVSMGPAYLQATVEGRTVTGQRQQALGLPPRGAQVQIGQAAIATGLPPDHKLNQRVTLGREDRWRLAGSAPGVRLPDELLDTLTLDARRLTETGVAELTVLSNQAVEVRDALRLPQRGVLTVEAPEVFVRASIDAPAGRIDLTAQEVSQPGRSGDALLQVDPGVALNARGAWVNLRPGVPGGDGSLPLIDGGSVSLRALSIAMEVDGSRRYVSVGRVQLGEGVAIDASGGALQAASGAPRGGRGGHIVIGGHDLQGFDTASVQAWGWSRGGGLSLTAREVQVANAAPADAATRPDLLWLDPGHFSRGGFARHALNALDRLEVADGTQVLAQVHHRVARADAALQPTGTPMAALTQTLLRPEHEREAVALALTARDNDAATGTLRIGSGARIEVDPGGSITVAARDHLEVDGTLRAPGGRLAATLERAREGFVRLGALPHRLWLGPQARLDASGTVLTWPDARGLRQGRVLPGGEVRLSTSGELVAQPGAVVDVSGAAPLRLDLIDEAGRIGRVLAGDAGTLRIEAAIGSRMVFDGHLAAQAGADGQRGGTLDLQLGINARDRLQANPRFDDIAAEIRLQQDVAPSTAGLRPGVDALPADGVVMARLDAQALHDSGIERLRVGGSDALVLADGVELGEQRELREVQVDVARIVTEGRASLRADTVRLGNYDTDTRIGAAGAGAGTGELHVDARLLELAGNLRLQGHDRATLTGREELRLAGVTRRQLQGEVGQGETPRFVHAATVDSSGDLTLRAGRVTTGTMADVQLRAPGRTLRFEAAGAAPPAPLLAAAGRLRVEARDIVQAGRIELPGGRIELRATDTLSLAPGSLTSVALPQGALLPLGRVRNATDWIVDVRPDQVPDGQLPVQAPPPRELRLDGSHVALAAGATVDIAGGGDLQAWEFTVGPGGSRDMLAQPGMYAVLPGAQPGWANADPQHATGLPVGEAVELRGVPGLPDGRYTLLPAHYALLPGGHALRLAPAASTLLPGQAHTRADGVRVAAGRVTDTRPAGATVQGDWRAIEVWTQAQVRERSEYALRRASRFLADGARLNDAGRLAVRAQDTLVLDAQLRAAAGAGGRGAAVDLAVPRLALVGAGGAAVTDPLAVRVDVAQLDSLNADSLVLGALRQTTADGTTRLEVGADSLTLANGEASALRAGELILAARDTLTLADGAQLVATTSEAAGDAGVYRVEGDGALLRVAASTARVERGGSIARTRGTLSRAADSLVQGRSVTMDATQDNRLAGQTRIDGADGQLALGASRVHVGTPHGAADGLVLTPDTLAALPALQALALTSYSGFDLHGPVTVGSAALRELRLHGSALTGHGAAGDVATLRAAEIEWANPGGVTAAAGGGSGTLVVDAQRLLLGAGDKAVTGFGAVHFGAAGELRASGSGTTTVQATSTATTVETARLTGNASAQQRLQADAGTLAVQTPAQPTAAQPAASGLGAGWTLAAPALRFDTRAELPSGSLALETLAGSSGDVGVGANARIDVAGRAMDFFDVSRSTWGGTVRLHSAGGNVTTAAGSVIDVSGGPGADAGRLLVAAPQGVAALGGTLRGEARADASGQRGAGGRFELDARTVGDVAALAATLHNGGFDAVQRLRQRSGDLSLAAGSTLRAQQIALAADTGSAFIAGTLASAGAAGARIEVHARDRVELLASGRIDAATTDGDGARVELGVDPTAGGRVVLHGGSVIDVSPGAGGAAGRVLLRAPRVGGNEVAVDAGTPGAAGATVIGAAALDIEAVRVYGGIETLVATGGTGSTLSLATVRSDNAAYAAHHATIGTRLAAGLAGGLPVRMMSGVEVRSSSNLRLAGDWHLGEPSTAPAAHLVGSRSAGVLTLRAAGDLDIASHLSDGFANAGAPPTATALSPAGLSDPRWRNGLDWSYRLVAGADLAAADPLSTRSDLVGNVVVAANRHVRTGRGDIQVAAGRNIELAGPGAVIYTAGALAPDLPGFPRPPNNLRPAFTQAGGDLTLQAGQNVVGSAIQPFASEAHEQLFNQWLFRQGRVDPNDPAGYATNPAWWLRFDQFRQGVGALGGGNVTVQAGQDVLTLTAVAPTQGRVAWSATLPRSQQVSGGGDVRIDAGRDVLGGQTYSGRGEVRVVAGGRIGARTDADHRVLLGATLLPVHPIVGLGDASAWLRAAGDVEVLAIVNPTLLPQSVGSPAAGGNIAAGGAVQESRFPTYGSGSAAALSSLGGRTVLHDLGGGNQAEPGAVAPLERISALMRSQEAKTVDTAGVEVRELARVLPPTLEMTAFGGDVWLGGQRGGGSLTTMPSPTGRLALLASDSVRLNLTLEQSDVAAERAASVLRPAFQNAVLPADPFAVAREPLRRALTEPARLVAVSGDVTGVSNADISLRLAQAAQVRAGRDIRDLNLRLQHAQASDRSLVQAGRDLTYSVGVGRTDADGIRVGGPGRLTLAAGRDVKLATSGGVLSIGNLANVNLPERGADIEILAGAGTPALDAAGAVQRLADRLSATAVGGDDTDLWLARWLTGRDDLGSAEAPAALAALQALPAQALRDRVRDFLFTALRTAGRDALTPASPHAGSYARGYAAVELVFPGLAQRDAAGMLAPPHGSVNLFASRVRTDRGGSIDILVPGGGIVAGLPDTPADLVGPAAVRQSGALGILTAAGGNVRALARDDILVNQSRILTVAGGDILLWASEGNIDAGRGAKTVSSVPPPLVTIDDQGRVQLELRGAAQGSGIGALSVPGMQAGTVDLFAPRGAVDAGDAGIRAGNLFIGALVVLGADNIAVGGAAVGVPVPDTTAVSAAETGATTGGGDADRITEAIAQGAAAAAQAAQQLAAALRPTVVTVEVLGFGN